MLRKRAIEDEYCCLRAYASAVIMGSDCSISEIYDDADNGSCIDKQRIRSRRCSMLQTAEDVSLEDLVFAVLKDAQPNPESERLADPTREQTQPNPDTWAYEGAIHGLHTLNGRGDWLTLSLKVPTKPAVDVLGVCRGDLRLSLDTNFAVVPPAMKNSKEVPLREDNEVTVSGTAPLVIITSAEDSTGGTTRGDMKGITTGPLPIRHPSSVREPNSVYRRLPPPTRGKASTHFPVSYNPNQKAERLDSSFDVQTKAQEGSFSFSSYQQIIELESFGIAEASVHQLSCVQTVGHGPGIAARCRDSRNPMRQTGNENIIMNSQSRQLHTAGKSTALLDQVTARPSESSLSAKAKSSEGQFAATNSVTSLAKIQLPCPSISSELYNKPNTSGYCRFACQRGGLPEYLSPLPCGVQEQSKLSLKFETPSVGSSPVSKASEFRNNLTPVLASQNPAVLHTNLGMKEQCEHCHMEVSLHQQPLCNQLDSSGSLESTKSKIKGSKPSESTSNRSNSQNDTADSGEGKQLLGVNYFFSAQVLDIPRPQGYLENPHCKGLCVNDVACCSSRLPPGQAGRPAYAYNEVDKVRYAPGKIVNQVIMVNNPDVEGGGRIHLESCDCSETEAVNFDKEGKGEVLQVEEGYRRADSKTESYIHRFHGLLQGFENLVKAKGRQSTEHFVPSRGLQRSSAISLASCPLSHAFAERQANSCKRKLAMSIVDESESENNNHFKKAGKCTITSLTEPESKSWKTVVRCDLCNTGPSLALGKWHAWCCGLPASRCWCPEQKKMKKQMAIGFRKTQKLKSQGRRITRHQWSGKVHKMCALWSSEVFQEDSLGKGNHLRLLDVAVKRGNNLFCRDPECRKVGATLGCRVKNCRHSYHYPCAERLASRCLLRMWDCLTIPIACVGHRYVEFEMERAKEKFSPKTVAEFERDWKFPQSRWKHPLGRKILSSDIAEGQEAVQIPCTNDVDDDPVPKIKYITKCWRNSTFVRSIVSDRHAQHTTHHDNHNTNIHGSPPMRLRPRPR